LYDAGAPAPVYRDSVSPPGRIVTVADECLFCRIVAGEVPADVVHRSDRVLVFRDINPQAPTHLLAIPTEHHADAAQVAARDPDLLAELVTAAAGSVAADGADPGSYRLVFNTGPQAGQSVFHAHLHALAGRPLGWPPG
jgi:histidine triad (HIT) family protein